MKYLKSYQLFERKGDYQLFHKTSRLKEILNDGYIIAGGKDDDSGEWWNYDIRKNVIPNLVKDKYKSISATRNLNYLWLPALELDVEKISDKYRIIPFSENPDFYIKFIDDKRKSNINPKLGKLQNMLRTKDAGDKYWNVKTNKHADDFGIAEEIILTDKLDVSKYVKRIILGYPGSNEDIIDLIHKKYPHIEVVEVDEGCPSRIGYVDIKKALKQKEKNREKVLQENAKLKT